ncbi:response regulator [Spirosoma sp. KCTC 42546]|uniref:response regulator n=1 Tax=Spirosoma sp. KCTC 42546 TaxID=2520506 RepID=UPI001159C394|nr:response regulator [Spirosoma sp. KCTC 42546]QDK77174.1 response regulator [Spirosoma sp. KCTC 42546]
MKNLASTNPALRDNFRNANLLIIEDNPDHGKLMKDSIGQCLPEVNAALVSSEAEALFFLNQCRTEEWNYPKLILLDLYLPERQNGWRLLEQIKAMPAAMGKIPVVLLSQSSNQQDILEAYQRGCSSYLIKPRLAADWLRYFQSLRTYWWETVTLPKVEISLF